MNFSVPFAWGAPEQETEKRALPVEALDTETTAIVNALAGLSKREKSLILVLIQTISAWGGLNEAPTKS